ncbi:VanZ family protein [Kitasatospora sp. NPDC048365]|uniref:VanZ family protein n=1 Tax=Kitasatospora sp. NPDC048365 TaxID=3364050 RepID=UPI00371526BE
MIEAIFSSAPALLPVFALLALVLGAAALRQARARQWPRAVAVLWGLSLAGEVAATLTPTGTGSFGTSCSIGSGVWETATTQQGLMNVALYVPLAYFGTLVLRRPLTVLAACAVLSALTELGQTLLGTGRSCDGADLVDNALGALLGTVAAVLWLWLRRRPVPFSRRDVLHGLSTAGAGLAAVTTVVWLFVPLHHDAPGFGAHSAADETELPRRIAAQLFGAETLLQTTRLTVAPEDPPQQALEVATDRGQFRIEWPTGRLLSSASADSRTDPGPLSRDQVLKVGTDFATTWFSDLTHAATPALTPTDRAYLLTYRRYNTDNVLMPMRLDITVSTSGRVMASSARWDADPQLPHPTLTADAAKQRAVAAAPGSRADTPLLLAKKVDGQWRPCWSVTLTKPGDTQTSGTAEFIDAVTGQPVAPQRPLTWHGRNTSGGTRCSVSAGPDCSDRAVLLFSQFVDGHACLSVSANSERPEACALSELPDWVLMAVLAVSASSARSGAPPI